MGAFTKWAKIAAAAGSVALLSVETVMLESSKAAESTRQRESEEQTKKALQLQPEAKAAVARSRPCSKAPKMAPQFDGLNFYETFIGCAQR